MISALLLALALTLPNAKITPGVTHPITTKVLCATKWGKDRRFVTEKMKRTVAESYGLERKSVVAYGKGPCCEFDHLISRELGGSDDIANLWPQPWKQAKQKDQLENRLHVLVCSGQLPLEDAQRSIATDWQAAFNRYVVAK